MEGIQGSGHELHIKPVMPNSILPKTVPGKDSGNNPSFMDLLKNSIQEINDLQVNANQQIEKLANGEIKDVHQVMIAAQEANLTFSMMMQIRNKIVDAYQEIKTMS